MADEEIGEFSYDYVELRPEPIRPFTIANRLQSNTQEEMAHDRPPDVPDEDNTNQSANSVGEVTVGSTENTTINPALSNLNSLEEAARRAWLSRMADERRARVREKARWAANEVSTASSFEFDPEFVGESPPTPEPEIDAKAQQRERFLESRESWAAEKQLEAEREAAEKERLKARFESRSDNAPSVRKRMNMIAQRNYKNSLRSDTASGSAARVRRDEYATSSSNAFWALGGLEELSDESAPDIDRSSDRGTGLWGEGYVNHPM